MGFAALAQLFMPAISSILDRIIPDPKALQQAKLEFQQEIDKAAAQADAANAQIVASQSEVIKAEAQSESWMARNWRPFLMFFLMAMLANQYFIAPYILNPLFHWFGIAIVMPELGNGAWDLLQIGMGGYVVGRSGEKMMQMYADTKTNQAQAGVAAVVAANFNETAFYAVIRPALGGSISKATADMLAKAIQAGKTTP